MEHIKGKENTAQNRHLEKFFTAALFGRVPNNASKLRGSYVIIIDELVNNCVYINTGLYTTKRKKMRTNIVIDDKLMSAALKTSGLNTKKEVVEEALRLLVKVKNQSKLRKLRGKLKWEGNLNDLRTDK